uniref:Uncharacterized protein n=1 Tax=Arundo donax TaxID=35708 RepID=A0A0A8ZCQ1_ARUDO
MECSHHAQLVHITV